MQLDDNYLAVFNISSHQEATIDFCGAPFVRLGPSEVAYISVAADNLVNVSADAADCVLRFYGTFNDCAKAVEAARATMPHDGRRE